MDIETRARRIVRTKCTRIGCLYAETKGIGLCEVNEPREVTHYLGPDGNGCLEVALRSRNVEGVTGGILQSNGILLEGAEV